MPIGGSLKAAEIALIRRWIDEGAVGDAAPAAKAPPAKPLLRTNLTPPATAVAYSPDGKWLAVATYQEVQLWEVASLANGTSAGAAATPPPTAPSPPRPCPPAPPLPRSPARSACPGVGAWLY